MTIRTKLYTVSFGVADIAANGADTLVAAADRHFYTARNAGRDRVCLSKISAGNLAT